MSLDTEYRIKKSTLKKEIDAFKKICMHCKNLEAWKGSAWCETCWKIYANRMGYHRLKKIKG